MSSAFNRFVQNLKKGSVISSKPVISVPPRSSIASNEPSNVHLNGPHSTAVGDCFWQSGLELAKVCYSKLECFYPASIRNVDDNNALYQAAAKTIKNHLTEQRSLVYREVMPLFVITVRKPSNTVFTEADECAHDYFINNCFYILEQNYLAWMSMYTREDDVEAAKKLLQEVAKAQREVLSRKLKGFSFAAREVTYTGVPVDPNQRMGY